MHHRSKRIGVGTGLLPACNIAASGVCEIGGGRLGRVQAAVHGEHTAGAESTRLLRPNEASLDSERSSTFTVSVLRGLLRAAHRKWKTRRRRRRRRCVRIVTHVPLQHRQRLIDFNDFFRHFRRRQNGRPIHIRNQAGSGDLLSEGLRIALAWYDYDYFSNYTSILLNKKTQTHYFLYFHNYVFLLFFYLLLLLVTNNLYIYIYIYM